MLRNGHHAYDAALQKVDPHHRAPLNDFVQDGTIPENHPQLMRLISDPDSASSSNDHAVVAFLTTFCPDWAYGHLAYMVRWEHKGGLRGGRLQ